MGFKKILISILLCIFGFSSLYFAFQYKSFLGANNKLRKQLLLNNTDLALDNLKQIKETWTYKGLSILKPKRYFLIHYYQGVANSKIGKFKEAVDDFSQVALTPDYQLSIDSKLAKTVSLWLSGKITPEVIRQMLESYADIITKDSKKKISWTQREAIERAYWIMTRRASQKKMRSPKDGDGSGMGGDSQPKRGKALKEEFKRLMKEKPLEKGR